MVDNLKKRDAVAIAKKLGAEINPSGIHQNAVFRHDGQIVLTFGIRHGNNSNHGHLIGENHDLKLNATRANALAKCTMSKVEYIEVLREKGIIE